MLQLVALTPDTRHLCQKEPATNPQECEQCQGTQGPPAPSHEQTPAGGGAARSPLLWRDEKWPSDLRLPGAGDVLVARAPQPGVAATYRAQQAQRAARQRWVRRTLLH